MSTPLLARWQLASKHPSNRIEKMYQRIEAPKWRVNHKSRRLACVSRLVKLGRGKRVPVRLPSAPDPRIDHLATQALLTSQISIVSSTTGTEA